MSANDTGRERPQRRIAPLVERENMEHEIRTMKSDESGESQEFSREVKKHISQEISGGGRNSRQLQRMEKVLAHSQPEPLTDAEISELEREEKLLIEKVQKMMVPKSKVNIKQFENGSINTEHRKAANHMAKSEWSTECQTLAHRLKNIRRQLRPDDPDAGNLEFIRPD